MKTAVEWLIEAMYQETYPFNLKYSKIFEQAKEMEKEQIYKALCRGHSDCGVFTMTSECEQYYNETFKSEKQSYQDKMRDKINKAKSRIE